MDFEVVAAIWRDRYANVPGGTVLVTKDEMDTILAALAEPAEDGWEVIRRWRLDKNGDATTGTPWLHNRNSSEYELRCRPSEEKE